MNKEQEYSSKFNTSRVIEKQGQSLLMNSAFKQQRAYRNANQGFYKTAQISPKAVIKQIIPAETSGHSKVPLTRNQSQNKNSFS